MIHSLEPRRLVALAITAALALVVFSAGLERADAQPDSRTATGDPPAGGANAGSALAVENASDTGDEAGAGNGATLSGAVSTTGHPESYLDFVLAGGKLMIPIGLCSLVWLTFFVERLFALRRARILPPALERGFEELLSSRDLDRSRADSLIDAHPSSAANIFRVAVDSLAEDRESIEARVDNAAQKEIPALHRYLRLFAVIAAVAPLLGLLGTVTGMIQAFREVAIRGLGSGQALAPGIYQALITTAAGLIVAIPALLTHHWLESRIEGAVHRINTLVVDFVEAFRTEASLPETTGARSGSSDVVGGGRPS